MKKTFRILLLLILVVFSQGYFAQGNSHAKECFMVLAGRDATSDGSVLIAHNNDLSGTETSFIEKIPAKTYVENEFITFPSGLKIPQVDRTYEWMVVRIEAGYAEGDAIAINEFGVSIGGGVALGDDRNEKAESADPLIKNGLTGGVRYVALERSKTARQCVEMIGSFYTKYGVTYPSGVSIADANEIWYIEAGGGHTWAAVRVPDNSFMAIANGYRIGKIDIADTANVLTSHKLFEFAVENNLWNPSDGDFNFAKAFGGGRANRFYDTRRVWRGISILSGDKLKNTRLNFPMFITPKNKIDVTQLIKLLRDKYEDTPLYSIPNERMICVNRTVHSTIVQLRNYLPVDIGAVLWTCLSVPTTSVYIPFYYGVGEINPNYNSSTKETSAFWKFRELYNLTDSNPGFSVTIRNKFDNIERKLLSKQTEIEQTALSKYKKDKDDCIGFLTYYVNSLCEIAVKKVDDL